MLPNVDKRKNASCMGLKLVSFLPATVRQKLEITTMKLFIFGAGFLFVCFVYAKPSANHANDVRNCYGFTCPEGTTTCIRNITTTPDDKYIRTNIVCRNFDGIELDSQVTSKDNSNSGVKVSSHSYKGSYVMVGGGGKSININLG